MRVRVRVSKAMSILTDNADSRVPGIVRRRDAEFIT